MIYLYLYVGVVLLLMIGFMIGTHVERKNGAVAAQKAFDNETAKYYTQKESWDAVESALLKMDNTPPKKQAKQHGHLRLIK